MSAHDWRAIPEQRDECVPWEGCEGTGLGDGEPYCSCAAGDDLRDEHAAAKHGPALAAALDFLLLQQGEDGPDATVPGDPPWA